jgi:hypothetical protein
MSVTCNKLACAEGHLDLETILLGLFAKNLDGCIGLKIMALPDTTCDTMTDVRTCGDILTAEEALKSAIVDDGCGGWALGVYLLTDE